MLVTKAGSKLWRYAYSFDSRQKLLALYWIVLGDMNEAN